MKTFERDGVVRVSGALPPDEARVIHDHLWELLFEKHGIHQHDPRTWSTGGGLGLTELVGAYRPSHEARPALWNTGDLDAFYPLEAALTRAVDQVFGPRVWEPIADPRGGMPMPAFPKPDSDWNVPHAAWHADEPTFASQAHPSGLLAFVFLDRVVHRGGGTMVLSGSPRRLHKLAVDCAATPHNDASNAPPKVLPCTVSTALLAQQESWFNDLFTATGDSTDRVKRFMKRAYPSKGIAMRVVELTGEPGDITLMDPRCLHTISANVMPRPRLVMRMICSPF